MSDVTILLDKIAQGDDRAADKLLPLVYDELRRKAAHYMAGERRNHTLQATALVNEAYLKLVGGQAVAFQSKAHFYNAAAEAMRRILVDHSRTRGADKRGGGRERVDLDQVDVAADADEGTDYESLDKALTKLQALDERRYRVVMLRYFAGLTEQQIAENLNVTTKTVQRDWGAAKLYLLGQIQG
jgi:RNA polymerase sigma factor (TIGR02999 family)